MTLRTAGLVLLFATAFTLTACGQKGPLYMPKDAPATAAPAVEEKPAEAMEDKMPDKNEADDSGK